MKYQVGQKIKYESCFGEITNFHEVTLTHKKVFEAKLKFDDKVYVILFSKEGYVFPFSENTPNATQVIIL